MEESLASENKGLPANMQLVYTGPAMDFKIT